MQHLLVHLARRRSLSLSRSLRLIQYRAQICRVASAVRRAARAAAAAGARGVAGGDEALLETGQKMLALPGGRLREKLVQWSHEAVDVPLVVVVAVVLVVVAPRWRTEPFRSLKVPFEAGCS